MINIVDIKIYHVQKNVQSNKRGVRTYGCL